MQLNTPPPGAGRAQEILPAVLRPSPKVRVSSAPSPRLPAGDALGAMLRGSSSWDSVATPVSWTVTLLSWLLIGLDVAAIFVIRAFITASNIFARIITWNYHPNAAIAAAVIAAIVMAATAMGTEGLRRANLAWLRVWIGGVVASVVAVVSTLVALALALLLGLLCAIIGIVVGFIGVMMLAGLADL